MVSPSKDGLTFNTTILSEYLAQQHHGILQEFQKISEIKSLPGRDTVTP